MREKIDQLRDLLDLPNRQAVSMTVLNGIVETTDFGDSYRSYRPSGDVAYVFVGPKDKLVGTRHVSEDGSITYTIRLAT